MRAFTGVDQRLCIRDHGRAVFEQRCRDADAARVVVVQEQGRGKALQGQRVDRLAVAVTHLSTTVGADGGEPFRIAITDRATDVPRFRQHAHGGDNVQCITGTEKTVQCLLA